MLFATGLEGGGVLQFPDDWCCTTDFAYLSHTAIKQAPLGRSRRSLFTRKKEGSDTGKWHQTPGPS